ncbi:MAG: D-alanine--D-alanine ligase [Alphaproteobacteria bacterium]|nr:D-alanine--D-alanine ligase [Alphaproteobacteria bacterium]
MKTVAVFFGGQTVEHDVSVLTGLQVMGALDSSRFTALPVYLAPDGTWFTGEALKDRASYMLTDEIRRGLTRVGLLAGRPAASGPALTAVDRRRLGGVDLREIPFDIALPAMHGTGGEDGGLQGLFQLLHIPFVGSGALGSAATMDKAFTKRVLMGLGIPVVPFLQVERPEDGRFIDADTIGQRLASELAGLSYPFCVKPNNLGSSVGVARVTSADELTASLLSIFRMDRAAVIEAFVPNLVEYNVAVTRAFGKTQVSAIERPLGKSAVLNFADKYLQEGGKASKVEGSVTEGMASAVRVLHPAELSADQIRRIEDHARRAFEAFDMHGAARIDFLCDSATGEIWLNEINSIPGSLSYYLWEPSALKLGFTDLLTGLIEEGFAQGRAARADTGADGAHATIFTRR